MANRGSKAVLSIMNLIDEAVSVLVANNGQGLIMIDYFPQLNEKSVEGLCQVLTRPGGTTGECPIMGLQCQLILRRTYNSGLII